MDLCQIPCIALFYDSCQDLVYREEFFQIEGSSWPLKTDSLYVGPEGVAAAARLTPEQEVWYKSQSASPYVSSLASGHQAKSLGPMVRRALVATDWQTTQIPLVCFLPSTDTYRIDVVSHDDSVLQAVTLPCHHGRECEDHPDSLKLLGSMPDDLWSQGPYDVGWCEMDSPITFWITPGTVISQPQYRHKPEAEQGLGQAIHGLLAAGVLVPSQSR